MENLKAKWDALETPAKAVVGGVAVVVSLVVIFKVLPYLLGAMSIGAFIALLILPYWIPTIVAFMRHHPSKGGILAMNLLLGWTFVGWVLSLVWALSDNSSRASHQTVVVNTTVTAAAAPVQPAYQVGDVVNGHRFNGAEWVPVGPAQPAPAVPAPQPAPVIVAPAEVVPQQIAPAPSADTAP